MDADVQVAGDKFRPQAASVPWGLRPTPSGQQESRKNGGNTTDSEAQATGEQFRPQGASVPSGLGQ